MPFITLSKIVGTRGAPRPAPGFHTDTDEPGEQQGEPAAEAPLVDVTVPVTINTAAIRCFYRRRNERPGTRLTFTDGGGFAVTEPYEDVANLIG